MSEKILTISEMEALLQDALTFRGQPIKDIAPAIGLRPNTIYEWRCGHSRLSARSLERLFQYLQKTEPYRIEQAIRNQSYTDNN